MEPIEIIENIYSNSKQEKKRQRSPAGNDITIQLPNNTTAKVHFVVYDWLSSVYFCKHTQGGPKRCFKDMLRVSLKSLGIQP